MINSVLDYWQHQEERGTKPRAVWLVVSQGRVQPRGHICGWSSNKRHAQKQADDIMIKMGDQVCLLRLY